MSRFILYGCLFLLLAAGETSFLSSLPFPWATVPLIPIISIWLHHHVPSRIGAWVLLAWGVWYDVFGLSLWSSRTVTALVMTAILMYASGRLFSQHSVYGLLGLSFVVWIGWSLVEALFRFFSSSALAVAFHGFLLNQSVILVELLLGTSFLFVFSLRMRERLRLT